MLSDRAPNLLPLWTQNLIRKNPQQPADLYRVLTGPRGLAVGASLWGHSQGHIPAKIWVPCLLAQGSFWGFRVQSPIWSDKRT